MQAVPLGYAFCLYLGKNIDILVVENMKLKHAAMTFLLSCSGLANIIKIGQGALPFNPSTPSNSVSSWLTTLSVTPVESWPL